MNILLVTVNYMRPYNIIIPVGIQMVPDTKIYAERPKHRTGLSKSLVVDHLIMPQLVYLGWSSTGTG